jgi:hypothetical protein
VEVGVGGQAYLFHLEFLESFWGYPMGVHSLELPDFSWAPFLRALFPTLQMSPCSCPAICELIQE